MEAAVLAGASRLRPVTIERIDLDREAGAWLAAVGLHEGAQVVVLRQAALGGPLHVRTSDGGEFAVAREIASKIRVRPAAEPQKT